jgi:hypothetical protein
MTAKLTSPDACEFYAEMAIGALTSYVIGKNSNVPNRNHLIIASIASRCARQAITFLGSRCAEFIHKKIAKQKGNSCSLHNLINALSLSLGISILLRFIPLQLPHFAATWGYLSITSNISFGVVSLGQYFISVLYPSPVTV